MTLFILGKNILNKAKNNKIFINKIEKRIINQLGN